MTVKGTLRWVSMLTLIGLVGGNFTGQAFAEGPGRFHVGDSSFTGQDLVAARHLQIITSTIGDSDCFGYPANIGTGPSTAPCGTLPDLPIQDVNDDPQTDIDLACTGATSFTFTHTFTIPTGAKILGALYQMNIGGVETAIFPTTVLVDSIPIPVPDTGTLGTVLLTLPIVSVFNTLLQDGQLVVKITRGVGGAHPKCDDVFVDFSQVIVVVSVPTT
jgi:hypothetical protein